MTDQIRAAQPAPPAEGEVAELVEWLRENEAMAYAISDTAEERRYARTAELLAQRHPAPVPVSERPWERDGWCDAEGRCWMGDPGGQGFIPSWRFCRPEDAPSMTASLPAHALPLPAGEVK